MMKEIEHRLGKEFAYYMPILDKEFHRVIVESASFVAPQGEERFLNLCGYDRPDKCSLLILS